MPTRACKRAAPRRGNLGSRVDDREPGADGALGVVLVRVRIAEIGQHAVAHVLGDVSVEARDLAGAAVDRLRMHLAHVLRIQLRRQRGRADQIAEHHGQLPPLGLGCAGRLRK